MLENGLTVTIVGMSVVFLFLIMLVISMTIMAKVVAFINKVCPEVVEAPAKSSSSSASSAGDEVAVAIAMAAMKMK